jgi:hypothetical protein
VDRISNEVIITVKTKNQTDFDPIKSSLKAVESAGIAAGQALMGGLGNAASSASKLGSSLGTSAISTAAMGAASTAASGGLNLVVGALVSMAAAIPAVLGGFVMLAPALLAAGGAAGAAATLFAGAAIALATLAIGFGGIGAALSAHGKAVGGGGGAAKKSAEDTYQAAKRIRDAERMLTDAKEAERDAAKNVNQARRDEIDRLRELDLALRGQKISQAEAAQALIEAKEKARRANIAGSEWEKAEANNAVKRAQLEYDSVSEKLGDLTEEKKKANKVGVEGSDQVQQALKRQADAHQAVLRAQEQLADAHHKTAIAAGGAAGGINAFNEAMKKLSPNAQKLVYALIDIEKRFHAIKMRVQDRLLDGFDTAVTDLADKWLPHLDTILGNMADHLNKFGKGLMSALGDSEFIKNIERAGAETGKFIDKMGVATNHLVDAFGRLAGHSGPVLQKIGDLIEKIFVNFDNWIKAADKSGKLDSFMQAAADTLQDIFDIGGLVFTIIGQLIKIIFPGSQSAGNSVFDSVKEALQKVSDWLGDKKNQKQITDFIDDVIDFLKWIKSDGIPIVMWLARAVAAPTGALRSLYNVAKLVIHAIRNLGDMWDWVSKKTASFLNWLSSSANRVGNGLRGMWHGIKEGFRDALNWVIQRWNNLSFTFPSVSFMGATLGGGHIGTPNIPYLASGGIAGGIAMVGERGRELVRLPQGSQVIPNGQTESMMAKGGGGGGHVTIGVDTTSGNKLMDAIAEGIKAYVKRNGGNVQQALGRAGAA